MAALTEELRPQVGSARGTRAIEPLLDDRRPAARAVGAQQVHAGDGSADVENMPFPVTEQAQLLTFGISPAGSTMVQRADTEVSPLRNSK